MNKLAVTALNWNFLACRSLMAIGMAIALSSPLAAAEDAAPAAAIALPPLTQALASFGAATTGETIYVFGGHIGQAHDHNTSTQTGNFWKLNLQAPKQWEALPSSTPMQGLALVAAGGKIVRIGGMQAKNAKDEEEDLHSSTEVSLFDPQAGTWSAGVPLPEGRSSHDAVAVGSKIYVVGGWNLQGLAKDSAWHEKALVIDVAADKPEWKELSTQPFVRRALSVAHANNKLYVVGGINKEGKLSKQVDILDLASGKWSVGPEIPGEDRNGFGIAAMALNDQVLISGMNGTVYRLSADGQSWQAASKLTLGRFFHRLLPWGNKQLIAVGGAAFQKPHLTETEVLTPSLTAE